jgi:uncharacterized protein (TIGR02266 family)
MEPDRPRRAPRVDLKTKAWCEAGTTTLFIPIWNASSGGLFLQTLAPLPAGTHTTLRFRVDEESEVVAEAEVVWSRQGEQGGMGVRFTSFAAGGGAFARFLDSAVPPGEGGSTPNVS